MIMINKKFFVTFLTLLTIYTFFKLFSDVEVEFFTISLYEYRQFSLNCGSVYQILFENIEYKDNNLRMNKVICYNNAVLKVLNTFLNFVFILILFIFGIKYFNKRKNTEDLSDLLFILKKRNKRDI